MPNWCKNNDEFVCVCAPDQDQLCELIRFQLNNSAAMIDCSGNAISTTARSTHTFHQTRIQKQEFNINYHFYLKNIPFSLERVVEHFLLTL